MGLIKTLGALLLSLIVVAAVQAAEPSYPAYSGFVND